VLLVCVDTNVFVRETHLLRKKAGPPLIHFLRGANGKFFIPEILRQEYLNNLVVSLTEAREQLAGPLDKLETLLGQRDNFAVPTNDQARKSGEERLADLATSSVTLALTDELMLAAGKRVLQKRAPTTPMCQCELRHLLCNI
jgi:hypothetical protein